MTNDLVRADHYTTELDYARRVGDMIVSSGKWSKEYNKDTVALLVMYAKEIGIHPVKALMCGFDIIQGKITMKPMMMNDMIRKAGHSIQIEQNDDKACIIKGTRRDNGDTCTIRFTIDDAKKAGLLDKDNYKKWTSNMLYSRAMGNLARMLFADVVGGVYMEGELDAPPAQKMQELKEPDAITVEPIDMETGEYKSEHTLEELHAACNMGTLEDVKNFVRFIAIAKKDSGWDEQKVIDSMLENDKALADFKSKLTKRIEKSYTETKQEASP